MTLSPRIRNLIFDLGEVIIDLDIPGTINRFSERTGKSPQEVRDIYTSSQVFLDYEKGLISDDAFHEGANRLFGSDLSREEFFMTWNGMLNRLPPERLTLLDELRPKYRVFLLSNTNALHVVAFDRMVAAIDPKRRMQDYVDHAYYSHLVKMRKPDAEIFQLVLDEQRILPEESLFLDDNADNIIGASALGIQTVRVTGPEVIFNLFRP